MRNEKSNRLLVFSRLIGISGVFACMTAAIVYLLLVIVGATGELDKVGLYIIAGLAVAFVAVALVLRAMSNAAARAEDEFEVSEVVEDAVDEVLETCADAADAAFETVDETVEEANATADEAASKGILQLTPEKKEKIVKAVKKNAPVILAVAATAAISIAVSNSARERDRAKVRRSILDLLY